MPELSLTIPYPPTVNTVWRTSRAGHTYKTAEGKEYMGKVSAFVRSNGNNAGFQAHGELAVHVQVWMPDARRRDLDNLGKTMFDAIASGLGIDDRFFTDIRITRMGVDRKQPRCEVTIRTRNEVHP